MLRPIAAGLPDAAWIGELPSGWDYVQLRRLLYVQSGDFISPDDFVDEGFPVFGGNGFRGYATGWNTDANVLLIGRYGALCGNVHQTKEKIWATEHAFRVFPRKSFDTRFMYYLLQVVNLNQYSARAAQPGLNSTIVEERCVPVPPIALQPLISAYLDRETTKIDKLVEKQGELLTSLVEHRRALITEAITLGLNPSIPLIDAGNKFFQKVPVHWSIKKLKYISPEITVGVVITPSKYYADIGVPALRSLNIHPMEIVRENLVFFDETSNGILSKSIIRTDDVVAVRTGQPGTTAVVPPELNGANCIDLILIRRSTKFISKFLAFVMNSDLAQMQYGEGSEGAIQQHFNIETAKNLLLPIPPVSEQREIICYLESRLQELDDAYDKSSLMIALLKERRAALITAAVTGQIDMTKPAQNEVAA